MFVSRVVGDAVFWSNAPLAGDSALNLPLHFIGASLLDRVGASRQKTGQEERRKDEDALHPHIL